MKRLICLIIACLLLTVLLVACADTDNGDGLDKFEQIIQSMNNSTSTDTEEKPFADNVYIIISQNASGAISLKAGEISDKIYEKTGVGAVVKYDNEEMLSHSNTLEIFIGDTNSVISQEALKSLRVNDYICKWDRGRIVIGGRNDASTLEAMEQFIQKVLHSACKTSLMNENVRIEHKVAYDISNITLNGYDLYDFTFVYSTDAEKEKLEVLRDHISNKSGYFLDVVSLQSVDGTSGKLVTLVIDPNVAGAVMDCTDGNVTLLGRDEYAACAVVAEFSKRLLSVQNGEVLLNIDSRIDLPYSSEKLKIGSLITKNIGEPDIVYLTELLTEIRGGGYDVITLCDLSVDIVYYIRGNLEEGYSYTEAEYAAGEKMVVISKDLMCKNLDMKILDRFVLISFDVDGETAPRYLIRSFAGEDLDVSAIANAYSNAVLIADDELAVSADKYIGIAKIDVQFGGEQISQSIYADSFCKISDVEKAESVTDGYVNLFLSFYSSLKSCEKFEALKDSAQ